MSANSIVANSCSVSRFLDLANYPKESSSNATAGIAIGKRRGLGHLEHVHVAYPWVQEFINSGRATDGEKHTKKMLADMFTKSLEKSTFVRFRNTIMNCNCPARESLSLALLSLHGEARRMAERLLLQL